MKSQWSNIKLKGQMMMKFYDFAIHGKLINKESNETKIKRFGPKIREKSLFQDQQKSKSNLGENEEQIDLKTKIDY